MRRNKLIAFCGIPILASSLGFAQRTDTPSTKQDPPAQTEDTRPVRSNPDYGWIGLLGLAGLLGLRRRNQSVRVDRPVGYVDEGRRGEQGRRAA